MSLASEMKHVGFVPIQGRREPRCEARRHSETFAEIQFNERKGSGRCISIHIAARSEIDTYRLRLLATDFVCKQPAHASKRGEAYRSASVTKTTTGSFSRYEHFPPQF